VKEDILFKFSNCVTVLKFKITGCFWLCKQTTFFILTHLFPKKPYTPVTCLSLPPQVMDHAIFHCDNAYKIPNMRVTGFVCKTNTPSNTAFRGFGGPQGMMMAEQWISDVAGVLGISPAKVGLMK